MTSSNLPQHHAFIVLGLGELYPLYVWLTRGWEKRYGIRPHIYVVGWKNKQEDFTTKLPRLITAIAELPPGTISLIGISAGASAALNAYAALKGTREIKNYTAICGRFNYNSYWWYPLWYGVDRIPAFKESVTQAMAILRKLTPADYAKMATFSALFDEIVPKSASTIPKIALQKTILYAFHFESIVWLFCFPKQLIKHIRSDV